MAKEDRSRKRPLEELLSAYPNIFVYRSSTGFFTITKPLSPTATLNVAVTIKQNRLNAQPAEILISGHTFTEQERRAGMEAKVVTFTPANNPNTYLSIKRAPGSQLETEVIYPRDEARRLDYTELLEDAMHGLEIFDAFTQQATPGERERYADRVVDEMADFDTEAYGRMVRSMNEDIPDFEEFLTESGIDARLIKGNPKLALMLLRGAKDLPITRITFQPVNNR